MKVKELFLLVVLIGVLGLGYISAGGASGPSAQAAMQSLRAAERRGLGALQGAAAAAAAAPGGAAPGGAGSAAAAGPALATMKRDLAAELASHRRDTAAAATQIAALRGKLKAAIAAAHAAPPAHAARSAAAVAAAAAAIKAQPRGHVHVDRDNHPQLMELVRRLNTALSPFFKGHYCTKGWAPPVANHFLAGCAGSPQCQALPTLFIAKQECDRLRGNCGGVVQVGSDHFELRLSANPEASTGGETAHAKLLCAASTAPNVYKAFVAAMEAALADPALHLDANERLFLDPSEDAAHAAKENSLFLSIASYRDPNCGPTVERAFANAARPEELTVGIVEQNCHADCMTGTGWGATRRWVHSKPDVDCVTDFCASAAGAPHCAAGRVRLLRLNETESYGPFFARYVASKLWEGQAFFMQVDSHSHFRKDWDRIAIDMLRTTRTFPHSIVSNYPPGHEAGFGGMQPGQYVPEALCDIHFADGIMRLEHTFRSGVDAAKQYKDPSLSLFIAAGFFLSHASFLRDVKYDPLLPYIFMGEEIIMSARAYTAGWDVYAPSVDVITHMYVRQESPKFWETVNDVYGNPGIHNELTDLILDRIKYTMRWPGKKEVSQLQLPSMADGLDKYGLGKKRPLKNFFELSGIDMERQRTVTQPWCVQGKK